MRMLWVVTKPPWPARDGGRVLVAHTLAALAAGGHEIVLVSPFDPAADDRARLADHLRDLCEPHLVAAPPRSLAMAALHARWRGWPVTVGRHWRRAVGREVAGLLAGRRFDVVHAEQLQAVAQCEAARSHSVPIVLRAQNVESDLWSALATSRPLLRGLAGGEAARLARYEGRTVREVAATVALTARDAERLAELSGGRGPVHHVPAPFPDRLPPGEDALDGAPAVVMLAGGWLPNRDGAAWFLDAVWPEVSARCPGAVLHAFGAVRGAGSAPAVVVHRPPEESRAAFAPGTILAVPLRIASGVRMKILEAWARGVPVVSTPEAAAGLDAGDGRELLIAGAPREFAAAIGRLHAEPSFARASMEAGRALLRARHDPRRIAHRLAEVYADVAARSRR